METLVAPPSAPTDEELRTGPVEVHEGQLDSATENGWQEKEDKDYQYRGKEVAIDKDGIETGWEFFSREIASGKRPAGSRVEDGSEMVTVRSPAGEGAWLVKEIPANEFDELQALKAQHEVATATNNTPDTASPPAPESRTKTNLAGEKVPLTPEEHRIQLLREQWQEQHPNSPAFYREQFSYDDAGNKVVTQEATIKPEDMDRLETVVSDYKLGTLLEGKREATLQGWAELEKVFANRKDHLLQRASVLGAAEGTNLDIIEKAAARAREEALQEQLGEAFPMPPEPQGGFWDKLAYRRAGKHVNAQRQALRRILEMRDQTQIESFQKDWEAHDSIRHAEEMDKLHGEAFKEDKTKRSAEERSAATAEAARLNESYDGALEQITNLPLYRELGGNTADGRLNAEARARVAEVIKAYQGHLGEIEDEDEREIIIRQAANDLRWQLGISLDKLGATQDQILKTTEDAQMALELWVRSMEPGDNPIVDLENYQNQRRKEQLWDGRRQKAAEYIGPVVFMRRLRSKFSHEEARPTTELEQSIKDIREALGLAIDPTRSRVESGADFLADPSKASNYRERVMAQLGLMRYYSRHEKTLMKGALLASAVGKEMWYGVKKGLEPVGRQTGEGLAKAWEALSDEEKRKQRKKFMLGMAVASKGLAARWAKKTASVGKEQLKQATGRS